MAEANRLALHAVEAGADSIGFDLSEKLSAQQVADLMADIDLNATELAFSGKPDAELPDKVLSVAEAKKADPEKFRVFFGYDPLIRQLSLTGAFCDGDDGQQCYKTIAGFVRGAKAWPKAKFVTVSGETFQNSGSTITQELAFTLAAGHEYLVKLTEAGLSAEEAARTIRFSMAVSSNYFMEMAKFRAGRMLWANIVNAYTGGCARKMFTHAVTSGWNITAYDPYVNMLRGTTEAMSASLAGVHSLEVLPFDTAYESPTEFSSRIARNVQLLLKNESHFDNVVDPAGGSYYIENLTQSIAEQAWKLFKEVEERGGYTAAFRDGFIPDAVKASAEAKDNAVATRRIVLLGTNQYPNFNEVADSAITEACITPQAWDAKVLRPYRGGMAFEQLRLKVDRSGPQSAGLHAHLRHARHGARPLAVRMQLLRLRRHPGSGQHLLPFGGGRRESRARLRSRNRGHLRRGRRLRNARPESERTARRTGALRRGRCTGIAARTRSAGHHPLHQRKEQRTRNPQGIR